MTYMAQWVIYNQPKDYPNGIIARLWLVGPNVMLPTKDVIHCPMSGKTPTYDMALKAIQRSIQTRMPDVVRILRSPGDDPCIVETWL